MVACPPGQTERAIDDGAACVSFAQGLSCCPLLSQAEPVKLVDLPEFGASEEENTILTEAAEEMRRRYGAMFKPSQACRPPHLNVDNLRDEMHQAISFLDVSGTSAHCTRELCGGHVDS